MSAVAVEGGVVELDELLCENWSVAISVIYVCGAIWKRDECARLENVLPTASKAVWGVSREAHSKAGYGGWSATYTLWKICADETVEVVDMSSLKL